jgi:hypothetical protein
MTARNWAYGIARIPLALMQDAYFDTTVAGLLALI